jgi:hypothetical protein
MARLAVGLCLAGLFLACGAKSNGGTEPDGGSGAPDNGAQPSKVMGRALDTRGQPLANVRIHVAGAGIQSTPLTATTDADGRYSIKLPLERLTYKAYGWVPVSYRGKEFCLRLGHDDAGHYQHFVGRDGAIRDFRWKLQGEMPDAFTADLPVYFGGDVRLYPEFADVSDALATVELQLTPDGPLVDGSQGQPLTRTVELGKGVAWDIPLGGYKVTATLIRDGGVRRQIGIGPSHTELAREFLLEFQPANFGSSCGYAVGASGVARASLYVGDL